MPPSNSTARAAPEFARSIFVRPAPALMLMLPERSITMASAVAILRCSLRSSIETGSNASIADAK